MKTFSDDALAAMQRGDAIVSASIEILPVVQVSTLFAFDTSFDYQIIGSIVDADPPSGVVPPSSGFDDTGAAPFGHSATTNPLTPAHPITTAWLGESSLWLKKDLTISDDGVLTISGHVENGAVFFLDDALFGSVNADNSQSSLTTGIPFSIAVSVTAGSHTLKILCLDEDSGGYDPDNDNTYFYAQASLTVAGSGDPIRLWGGYGAMDLPSDEGTSTFLGIGDRGLVNQSVASIGGSAQNLTLALSGIEPAALEVLDPDEVKGASVVVRRLIFDSAGKTLLGAYVYTRGRVDELKTSEVIGGPATIELSVEGAARGLGRRGGRLRSDADQRLVSSTDGFYRVVSAAPKKTLYWGGKKPSTAGSSLGSGGTSAPSSSASKSVAV